MGSTVLGLAKRRKTVRSFHAKPVELEEVLGALEVACEAPSGANSQPWRFLVVMDPRIKRNVREACEQGEKEFYANVPGELKMWFQEKGLSWDKPFLEDAPILVLVLSQGRAPYSTESVWLAIGYILLDLEEASLSTITYTPSRPDLVGKNVDFLEGYRLKAILPIGYSADEKPKEPRLALRDVSYPNAWGSPLLG